MNSNIALLLLVFVLSETASANCRIVSLEENPVSYIHKMIKGTPDIYYAEATTYSQEDEAMNFRVLEVLKGEKRTELSVLGGQNEKGLK